MIGYSLVHFPQKTDFQEACPPALPVLVGGDELIIRVPGLDVRREHTIWQ